MKITKSTILAALLVIGVALSATANDPANAGFAIIPVTGSSVFKVVYKGESDARVSIKLFNAEKNLVFAETLTSANGFIRPLNLEGLASGEYTFELTSPAGKYTHKVTYSPVNSIVKYVHVSPMRSQEGKYIVAVVANNKSNNDVTVRIYNDNKLVHSEVKSFKGEFAMVYNMQSFNGNVSFEVVDNSGVVSTVNF